MGSSESKQAKDEEEEEEGRVYEPYLIQWDQHGHLRYGEAHKVDPGRQMVEIMELDYVDDIDGKKWYIIDTAWLSAWLAFVHLDKKNAPAPGPCDNRRLIQWDPVQGKYVGRHGLLMSSKHHAGDFRRISRETWQKFKEFYPGSGPSITIDYNPSMSNGEEPYIGKHFVILDPPPAPKVTISKSKKKKALAAAAAAEAAAAKAAAEKAAAEKAAADKAAAAAAGGPVAMNLDGYGSDDDGRASRAMSMSSVSTANKPKVVSNLPPPPGQARNPVAEQFTRQAMERANEDTTRLSERTQSFSSQQSGAGAQRYGSFSTGPAGSPPLAPVAPSTVAPAKRTVSTVQDMYYAKD